jgi:hypothetical protein
MNKVKASQIFYELGNNTGTVYLFHDLLRLQNALVEESKRTDLASLCTKLKEMVLSDESDWNRFEQEIEFARYAPSITIRSESELLGVSMPRFSIRIYLDKDEKFVINLRRKAALIGVLENQSSLTKGWSKRKSDGNALLTNLHPVFALSEIDKFNPISQVKSSSWIADCFLQVPFWIEKGEYRKKGSHQMLSQNWGDLIGEPDGDQTVYVEGLHLSGVCAQMGIFMASAALGIVRAPLFPVAEITFLLGDRDELALIEEFTVTEASPPEIIRYFDDGRVRLTAQHQFPNPEFSLSPVSKPLETEIFGLLIRSYIMSNASVMLIGDRHAFYNLWTSSDSPFTERNQSCFTSDFTSGQDELVPGAEPHVCCVVGCSLDDKKRGVYQFVVHDPVAGPYLTCNAEKLFEALDNCYDNEGSVSVITVAPRGVRLSFGTEIIGDNDSHTFFLGVHDLAEALATSMQNEAKSWLRQGKPNESEFRLVKFCNVLETLDDQLKDVDGKRAIIDKVSDFLTETDRRESDDWCWLQFGSSLPFALLWNAGKRGPEFNDALWELNFVSLLVVDGYLLFGAAA